MQEEVDQVHGEWVPVDFQLLEPRLPGLVVPSAGSDDPQASGMVLSTHVQSRDSLAAPNMTPSFLKLSPCFLCPCCPTLFWLISGLGKKVFWKEVESKLGGYRVEGPAADTKLQLM